jgi:hypothetical protein
MLLVPSTTPASVLVALIQLENHPDFQELVNYLQQCLAGERAKYEIAELPDLAAYGRQQGRVAALSQLVELATTARVRLSQIKSRAAGTGNESRT